MRLPGSTQTPLLIHLCPLLRQSKDKEDPSGVALVALPLQYLSAVITTSLEAPRKLVLCYKKHKTRPVRAEKE